MPNLIVGLGVAVPAFAESFPSNGYMLENKTYANAATDKNMGAYDGTVTATAEYANTLYQIIGGTYLPAGAEVADQCPANSYCPGVTDATYNASASQGATSCPSGYPNSATGASAITQCYTACKDSMVEHASAVSGNDYYGDGTDTCFATACENGYHVNETGKVITQRPLIDVDYTTEENVRRATTINGNGEATTTTMSGEGWVTAEGDDTYGLAENNTWAVEYGDGVVYGRASCQSSAHDAGMDYLGEIETNPDISPDQIRSDLTPIAGAGKANYTADTFAALQEGSESDELYEAYFSLFYVVFGLAKDASFSTSDTGGICYCQITGFQSASSGESGYDISKAVAVKSAPWVFAQGNAGAQADGCASECTLACLTNLLTPYEYMYKIHRDALFGARDFVDGGTCDANEIKINWTDAKDEDIAANNAGICTYGGDIRTPVRAATKPGKTFVGWKFSK